MIELRRAGDVQVQIVLGGKNLEIGCEIKVAGGAETVIAVNVKAEILFRQIVHERACGRVAIGLDDAVAEPEGEISGRGFAFDGDFAVIGELGRSGLIGAQETEQTADITGLNRLSGRILQII